MRKPTILISILLLAVIFMTPFTASASTNAGIKPGSVFYFFDTAFEKINLFFTFNPETKAEKALEYAEERMAEAEAVANENKPEAVAEAMENYQASVSLATTKAKEVKDETKAENLLTIIADNTSKHQETLAIVLEKVPDEAKDAILKAIEVSKKGHEQALNQVAELKKEVSELKREITELKNETKELEEQLENKEEQNTEKQKIRGDKTEIKNNKTETKTEVKKPALKEANKETEVTLNNPNNNSAEIENLKKEIQEIKAVQETLKSPPAIRRINISQANYGGYDVVLRTNSSNRVLSANVVSEGNSPVSFSDVIICMEGTASHAVVDYLFLEKTLATHYSLNSDGCITINNEVFSLQPKGIGGSGTSIVAYISLAKNIPLSDNNKTVNFILKSVASDGEISGSLPIIGYTYKVPPPPPPSLPNVTVSPGRVDSRNNQQYKELGTKDYIFSGIKITTDKKVFLNSIKWNMPGSGGSGSFENLKTYIDNTPYGTSLSSDGKYYTSNFGGIVLNINETKEIYIKGDIVGNGWLSFEIYKATDINITDEDNNVITPEAEQLWNYENSGGFRNTNPWYDGYKVEVKS